MFLTVGAEAMYFIDKDNKDKAIGYATDLSDSIGGRSIKVSCCVQSVLWFILKENTNRSTTEYERLLSESWACVHSPSCDVAIFSPLQTCTLVLKQLKKGAFGECSTDVIALYTQQCAKLFPMATAFKTDPSLSTQTGLPDKGKVSKPDKVGRKVQPVSNVAMSIMSGDINDGSGQLPAKDCVEPTVDRSNEPSQLADGPA